MSHAKSLVSVCSVLLISQSALADVWSNPTPGSFDSPRGYVTWDRGSAGSAFAQWDVLYQAEGNPNHATNGVFGGDAPIFDSTDLLGNPTPGSSSTAGTGIGGSSITQLNSGVGAIITSTSNIYSFGGTASYALEITDISSFTSLVITTLTSGTEIDYNGFSINSGSIQSSQTLYQGTHPTGGSVTETQWMIDLSTNTLDDLTVSFSGAGAHMSLMKVSVDTFVVPAPGSCTLLAAAGFMACTRRRK